MSNPNWPPDPGQQPQQPPQYPPQYPPPPSMPYATPNPQSAYYMGPVPLPRSVMVLSIIGIVMAALSLICKSINLVAHATIPEAAAAGKWDAIDSVLSILFAIVLLTACINCLRRQAWARKLMVTWSIAYIGLLVLDMIMVITVAIPQMIEQQRAAKGSLPQGFEAGAYCGGVGVLLLFVVYPIFVLAYMRKPEIVAAFEAPQQ